MHKIAPLGAILCRQYTGEASVLAIRPAGKPAGLEDTHLFEVCVSEAHTHRDEVGGS